MEGDHGTNNLQCTLVPMNIVNSMCNEMNNCVYHLQYLHQGYDIHVCSTLHHEYK